MKPNDDEQLQHKLRNVQAENQSLKNMLESAAEQLQEVVESHCADEAMDKAMDTAERLRRIATIDQAGKPD